MATSLVSSNSNDVLAGLLPPFIWKEAQTRKTRKPRPVTAEPTTTTCAPVDATAARAAVLLEHLPLVRFVARNIHERLPRHVELEDLVSAGTLGLIDAFNKFDAGKNIQFRSYAQFRIRGAILDSLRSLDWGSRELRRKGRRIESAIQKLTGRQSRTPTECEVAAELKMTLNEYQELLGDLKRLEIGSLQEAHAEGSVEEELVYVPTAPEEDPLYRCIRSQAVTQLGAAIAELPEREARVLALYYVEELTLKEIGIILGLVESRVSQIRASAVGHLRIRLAGGNKQPVEMSLPGANSRRPKRHQPFLSAATPVIAAASARHTGQAQVN